MENHGIVFFNSRGNPTACLLHFTSTIVKMTHLFWPEIYICFPMLLPFVPSLCGTAAQCFENIGHLYHSIKLLAEH